MGGLISAQEAQRAGRRLDGVVSTCGLLGGGVDLNNYQLDGEYAISRLLAPDQGIRLVNYASPAEGAAAAAQLSAVATAARATAAGRARVALGTALLDMPTWSPQQPQPPARHDFGGIAQAQFDWMVATLPFIMPARFFIELAVGGNASWNVGVNYADLVERSPYRDEVRALYREAGLDLRADLADLTRHASVPGDRRRGRRPRPARRPSPAISTYRSWICTRSMTSSPRSSTRTATPSRSGRPVTAGCCDRPTSTGAGTARSRPRKSSPHCKPSPTGWRPATGTTRRQPTACRRRPSHSASATSPPSSTSGRDHSSAIGCCTAVANAPRQPSPGASRRSPGPAGPAAARCGGRDFARAPPASAAAGGVAAAADRGE